jgi:NADPH2:quinone reductase
MRAAWYERNGPAAEVLTVGEMPAVAPAAGEVRIRVHASGVNPSDVKARAGLTRKIVWPRLVPDSDAGGVIDAVGPGVTGFAPGDRVWCFNGQWQRPFGTCAEYVTLPASIVAKLPAGLDFVQGACLGIPVMTAHRCLFADGPVKGKTILVTGGAGVVGHYAVQLAKWGGAQVVATVSSPAKAEAARQAGADHVVDYRRENVVERVKALVGAVDGVVDVDAGDNMATSLAVIRQYAFIAGYASTRKPVAEFAWQPTMQLNPVIRPVFVYTIPDAAKAQAIADIDRWCATGKAIFNIGARFALDDVVAAHECVEKGERIGLVVVET